MTPELTAFYERSAAAERAGDAEEALAYHSSIPMFRKSRHRSTLEQLVSAREDLTPWVWARWVVYQALRTEEKGSRTSRQLLGALRDSVDTFHDDLMGTAYDEGGDPIQVTARVMGESWAHHQLAAHEYGALAAFLDEFAADELAEQAGLARTWVGARMGGYRIGGRVEGACALEVCDLADGTVHEVLDLGAASVAGPERTVIGRLVPSGTRPQLMFDTVPLPVSQELALAVARGSAEGGDWAEVVAEAIDEDRLDPDDLFREDYELMSDVPSLELVSFGTRATDLARVMSQLRSGRDEVGRAAFRILRSASEGSLEPDAAPYVAAAVLNVHAYEQAPRRLLLPGQRQQWLGWAELAPDPARGRLLRFAEATAEVA